MSNKFMAGERDTFKMCQKAMMIVHNPTIVQLTSRRELSRHTVCMQYSYELRLSLAFNCD